MAEAASKVPISSSGGLTLIHTHMPMAQPQGTSKGSVSFPKTRRHVDWGNITTALLIGDQPTLPLEPQLPKATAALVPG